MTDKKTKTHDPKKDEKKIPPTQEDELLKKVHEAAKADQETQDQAAKQAKAEPSSAKASEVPDENKKKIEPSSAKATEAQLNENNKRIEELTNHLARCMADLQNYRRRSEEDKGRFVKFANAEMLKVLLPAFENLDRSCKHLPDNLKEDSWAKGVLHTQADLWKALEKLGVKKIETVGKKLDLKLHEALIAGPGEKDVILEELDPGYTINGETLKAAKVKVGDGNAPQSTPKFKSQIANPPGLLYQGGD